MPTLEDFVRARAMRASPQYAARIMKSEAEQAEDALSHPAVVAKAYSALQQFLQQKALADKASFEQQAAANFRVPQSLESMPQYQEPSPLQQWRNRLDAMMQSGNPVLQKQAISELQVQSKETVDKKQPKISSSAQVALDLGYKPGTKAFNDFVRAHAMKSGSSVTIDMGNKLVTREDAQNLIDEDGNRVTSVPLGLTYEQAAARRWSFGNPITAEEAKQEGSLAAVEDMLLRLEELTSSGQADLSSFKGIIDDYRSGSGILNAASDRLLDVFGEVKKPEDVEAHSLAIALGNQLLQAYRGAAVGPEEKIDFILQLPTAGQPKAVFDQNVQLTKRNLATIAARKRSMRGVPEPSPATKPQQSAAPTVVREWQEGGYQYQELSDGKKRRRKL